LGLHNAQPKRIRLRRGILRY